MAIAPSFQKYLAAKNLVYDVVAHEPTMSSMRTAEACRISGDRVAKAVVLRDEYGYVLAILPASHHIRLDDLRTQLGLDVDLAAEYEIEELFDDCVPGAISPVGECYGLETVVDEQYRRAAGGLSRGRRPRDARSPDPRAVRIAYRDGAARQLQRSRLTVAGRRLHGRVCEGCEHERDRAG